MEFEKFFLVFLNFKPNLQFHRQKLTPKRIFVKNKCNLNNWHRTVIQFDRENLKIYSVDENLRFWVGNPLTNLTDFSGEPCSMFT